jgi:membrane protein implicated in regulation of membrane protease activity
MIFVIIFFFLGLGLIYLEFFLPGVMITLIGTIFLILSLLLFGIKIPNISYIIFAAVVELVLLFTVIKLAMWQVRRKDSLVVKK